MTAQPDGRHRARGHGAPVRALLLTAVALAASAHVGSPDVWFEGSAGPYHVLVHVAAPGVIPGVATVRVRVDGASDARVTAVADHVASTGGAPPPEPLAPDADAPGWYAAPLWIMTTGSYGVTIEVSGSEGSGRIVVPLGAAATRRLEFGPWLGMALGAAGAVLLAGLLTIVGATVREGVLPPGALPDAARRARARRATARAALVLALALFGGWRWWRLEDERFARSMFRPMSAAAVVQGGALVLAIQDSSWIMRHDEGWRRARTGSDRGDPPAPLAEDHGKLMHLFLVDASGGGALAHLHPRTTDSVRFRTPVPPLPPGRYTVFADIVHTTGSAQTLVATLELPPADAAQPTAPPDPDDSWAVAREAGAASVRLADGSTLTRLGAEDPVGEGEPVSLRFALTPPAGEMADLEPYLGMLGHAAVLRDDHGVFVHLHPMGTISMAAQERLAARAASHVTEATPLPPPEGRAHDAHARADTLAFPYAFPAPGRYFVWVQIKRGGRVLTSVFEVRVGSRKAL